MSDTHDLRATPEQEAMLNSRVKPRCLRECSLPAGFRLVHPQPRQSVIGGQVRWAFVLGYRDYYELFQYNHEVPDETQMAWAVDNFRRQLMREGVIVRRAMLNNRQRAEAHFAGLETAGLVM